MRIFFINFVVDICRFSRMNWDSFRFIDLFAGIGGIRLGFEALGGKPRVG